MIWFIVSAIILFVGFAVFTGAPYVPSKRSDLSRAFTELYALGKRDTLVDIGSGDGVVLREARKYGAGKAIGYEIQPMLVMLSRWLSRHDKNVRVSFADYRRAQFPKTTTVVYTFGDSHHIAQMYAKVAEESMRLNRELAFITYAFEIDGIAPERTVGAHHLYRIKPLRHSPETV